MAENNQTSNFERYGYGALAGRLLRSNPKYANGSLDVLAGEEGLNLGEDAVGFIRGTQASKEGVETAISVYAGKFEEERGRLKPSELASWYDSVLEGLDEGDKDTIIDTLGKYDETVGDLTMKVTKAQKVLEAPEAFGKIEVSKANGTMRKYGEVLSVISMLDEYVFERMRPVAVEATRKRSLEALAKQL